MSSTAQYASITRYGVALLTTGDTSRTAPTVAGTVLTATATAASGTRIDSLDITATAATTATMLRLFIYANSVYSLLFEVPIPAVTPSSTVPVYTKTTGTNIGDYADYFPIILPTGASLRATVNDTQIGINVGTRLAGDFA